MRVFAVLLLASPALSLLAVPEDLAQNVMGYALDKQCWGEETMNEYVADIKKAINKCLDTPPKYTMADLFPGVQLPTPEVDPIEPAIATLPAQIEAEGDDAAARAADNMAKFISGLGDLKNEKALKISNLSCVMQELQLWTEEEKVNIDFYLSIFGKEDRFDADFVANLKVEYQLCYDLSQSFEVPTNVPPFAQKFVRQAFFARCAFKHERQLCVKQVLAEFAEMELDTKYDAEKAKSKGMPPNRFDWGLVYKMAKLGRISPVERFLYEFTLHGQNDII